MARRTRSNANTANGHAVNDEIQAREVRLVDADGDQLGVFPLAGALDTAERAEMDLVEVAPEADPPVARLMDYGKFVYEQSVKERGSKRASTGTKEMKYRPNIGEHDFETKTRKVADFLRKGNKVKVTVWLRGRERSMPGLVDDVVDRVVDELDEMLDEEVVLESPPKGDGPQRSAVVVTEG